ncbi:hypothetical protein DUNSADRAFT_59 [Dunaliella salina]|uniref:Uncharacterized protein n=1 Tax=Dunaliella salina TaxID=3046 RepID=A0ABQ7HAQ4_DUNSA|nr:hypothetical protein DUNSADRAFT_59 [Dunaliella salina]|eukprot:KAF5843937.1 hypothetical protein DUNSADRAFT_59 [Dunaliella salina]
MKDLVPSRVSQRGSAAMLNLNVNEELDATKKRQHHMGKCHSAATLTTLSLPSMIDKQVASQFLTTCVSVLLLLLKTASIPPEELNACCRHYAPAGFCSPHLPGCALVVRLCCCLVGPGARKRQQHIVGPVLLLRWKLHWKKRGCRRPPSIGQRRSRDFSKNDGAPGAFYLHEGVR